jgi:hypothetical protein
MCVCVCVCLHAHACVCCTKNLVILDELFSPRISFVGFVISKHTTIYNNPLFAADTNVPGKLCRAPEKTGVFLPKIYCKFEHNA